MASLSTRNTKGMATRQRKKRNRVVRTLATKVQIIRDIEGGQSQGMISKLYDIPRSTVHDIYSNKNAILREVNSADFHMISKNRKTLAKSKFFKLNSAIYQWMQKQRNKNIPISGCLLREKALAMFPMIYPELDKNSFVASQGWLHRFNKNFGIRQISLQGESLSADLSMVNSFRQNIAQMLNTGEYNKDQIFNADETILWWRGMPTKTLACRKERKAKNYKKSKDRITVLTCSNASGKCRLPLAVVYKYANPKCFKNLKSAESLPVTYYSQRRSWMVANLFEDWFKTKFVPFVLRYCRENNAEEKILLILDKAPTHLSVDKLNRPDGKITVMFLPANTTSIMQPMDQGVIEALKRLYKKRLLRHVIEQNEVGISREIPDILASVTIKDVVYWLSDEWRNLKETTLENAWNNLLKDPSTLLKQKESKGESGSISSNNINEVSTLFASLGINDTEQLESINWLANDYDPGSEQLAEAEIADAAVASSSDSEIDDAAEPKISHQEAFDAFSKALLWLETREETDPAHLILVRKWRDQAGTLRIKKKKQQLITSYFRRLASSTID